MRRDPALKAACDRDPDQGADLASQPTLSRFENEVGPKSCYLLAEKLFESYLQRHKQRPSRLILDLRYDRRPRCTASRSFAISAPTTTSTFTNRC